MEFERENRSCRVVDVQKLQNTFPPFFSRRRVLSLLRPRSPRRREFFSDRPHFFVCINFLLRYLAW